MAPQRPNGSKARDWSLAVSNLLKLAGAGLALFEVLFRPGDPHFSLVLAVAALLITGGQGLGTFLDKLFGTGK